jgi:hypothetical protein
MKEEGKGGKRKDKLSSLRRSDPSHLRSFAQRDWVWRTGNGVCGLLYFAQRGIRSRSCPMDVENSGSSLLSKARCCTSCISLFQKWFSSGRGQFYFFFFLNLLALSDLLSDIYVTMIYFQKQYFIFAICSMGFLALPALITAVFFAISFADDECDLSIGFQILIGWAFCLIWPVLVVIRPCVTSSELPFEHELSKNYKFICCFLESIPQ